MARRKILLKTKKVQQEHIYEAWSNYETDVTLIQIVIKFDSPSSYSLRDLDNKRNGHGYE